MIKVLLVRNFSPCTESSCETSARPEYICVWQFLTSFIRLCSARARARVCVCACVRACVGVCVRVCVCVCVCVWISVSTRLILTGHFLFVFWFNGGQKSVFWLGCVFVLFRIFDFLKIIFCLFLMINSKYLYRMGIIRKESKIPIFSKKKKF